MRSVSYTPCFDHGVSGDGFLDVLVVNSDNTANQLYRNLGGDRCLETCPDRPDFASDGFCDDGGPGSQHSHCGTVGTDCDDSGVRYFTNVTGDAITAETVNSYAAAWGECAAAIRTLRVISFRTMHMSMHMYMCLHMVHAHVLLHSCTFTFTCTRPCTCTTWTWTCN